MSRDDYVGIVKVGKKFKGYWLSASQPIPTLKELRQMKPKFVASNLIDAVLDAQDIDTEYGYSFFNLKRSTE